MNLNKTIEYVKTVCDSYIDSDLVIKHINKDYFIVNEESDYVFINCGFIAPLPILNEFEIYSVKKETFSVSEEEFRKFGKIEDKFFGILFLGENYILGTIELCDCKIDSKFSPLEKNSVLYKKLNEIAISLIR